MVEIDQVQIIMLIVIFVRRGEIKPGETVYTYENGENGNVKPSFKVQLNLKLIKIWIFYKKNKKHKLRY